MGPRRSSSILWMSAFAAPLVFSSPVAQSVSLSVSNLINNGSFEAGVLGPPFPLSFALIVPGSTVIEGWTIGGAGVDLIGTLWQASSGERSLDMSAADAGVISQSFATTPGQPYLIEFDLAGNPTQGVTTMRLTASAGGTSATFEFDTAGASTSDMRWSRREMTFVATSAQSTLVFTSLENNNFGPALDNVRVSPVPEPAAWALLAAGLGIVVAASLRRTPLPR